MGLEQQFDLESVRQFVMAQLCERNGLVVDAFPITQRVLYRQSVECGIFYCLHGPRSIRLTAVFDTETRRILLYDSRGQRSGAYDLSEIESLVGKVGTV